MKYEDFKSWIEKNCMYETFYEDSEGRIIMILTELDAWAMCNKFAEIEREACAKIADEWSVAYPHPSKVIAEQIRARGQK